MKHYIGQKVIISDRYHEWHNYYGYIDNIEDNNITVRFDFMSGNTIAYSKYETFNVKKVRNYKENTENIFDIDIFYKITYQAFIDGIKSKIDKAKNYKVYFGRDIEEYLLNFDKGFFNKRNLYCICKDNLEHGIIYEKEVI